MARKQKPNAGEKKPPKLKFFERENVPDQIGRFLDARKLVPKAYWGTDRFLDIVSWNIRWFDSQDPRRIKAIRQILGQINADILVLTEIAEDGALDDVAKGLAADKVGYYSTHYGTTGGQQRVVLMWDRDWIRAKAAPVELYRDDPIVLAEGGRKAEIFPRRPLWGYFEGLPEKGDAKEGFTFELLGVHLKSQMAPEGFSGRGGIPQRTEAAKRLAKWLDTPAEHFDEDVLIVGDFNAEPESDEWKALAALENSGKIDFKSINAPVDGRDRVTHLARLNKSGFGGTRLDMQIITSSEEAQSLAKEKAAVIRWSFADQLSALEKSERDQLLKAVKMNFSDHLPVVSRFYFSSAAAAEDKGKE